MRAVCIVTCAIIAVWLAGCRSEFKPVPEPEEIQPAAASADAIRVTATDYTFEVSAEHVRAGTVDFVVRNGATRDHEFVIVPLEGARYGLPLGEIEAFGAQETRAMRAQITPGRYELVCLIVSVSDGEPASHLALGMRTPFEVTK